MITRVFSLDSSCYSDLAQNRHCGNHHQGFLSCLLTFPPAKTIDFGPPLPKVMVLLALLCFSRDIVGGITGPPGERLRHPLTPPPPMFLTRDLEKIFKAVSRFSRTKNQQFFNKSMSYLGNCKPLSPVRSGPGPDRSPGLAPPAHDQSSSS